MRIRSTAVIGVIAGVALLTAACTESSTPSSSSSTATQAGSGTTVAPTGGPATTRPSTSGRSTTPAALRAPRAAARSRSGTRNQEDVFPEATIGIDAAVKYVNAELGGIGGHPVVLTKCKITVEEDGQRCGTQFANDSKVSVVMTGTLLVGAKGLYDTLAGKKPVVIGNGLTTDDFTTTAGYSLFTGAVGVVGGLANYVATKVQPKPKTVAVMYGDNASAQGAVLAACSSPCSTRPGSKSPASR